MTKWFNKKILAFIFILLGGGIAFGAVDSTIQTQAEVTNIIETRQELCLKDTGKYCQFLEGKVNPNLFRTDIKEHDYGIRVDVWEGGKGDLHNQQGYTIRFIEPVIPFVSSTST